MGIGSAVRQAAENLRQQQELEDIRKQQSIVTTQPTNNTTPTITPLTPFQEALLSEEERKQRGFELSRQQRERDIARGFERGQELFGEGALGRVRAELTPEQQQIRAARQGQLAGLEAPEFEALRERRLRELQLAQQQQQRGLRGLQAGAGIRGGLAGQQALGLAQQQQQQRQQAEQELLLQNVAQRQQALGAFEQSIAGQERDILQRELANIEARRRELLGQQTFALGEASLGAAERGAVLQELVGRQQALAGGGGGGKK